MEKSKDKSVWVEKDKEKRRWEMEGKKYKIERRWPEEKDWRKKETDEGILEKNGMKRKSGRWTDTVSGEKCDSMNVTQEKGQKHGVMSL